MTMHHGILVKITTHFFTSDPECNGDYCKVTVKLSGTLIREYGDAYHDNGAHKAEGFVDGYLWANRHSRQEIRVVRENIADYEG